jgi:NMD protein affecting ribosome stability and mRNA decay
MRTCDDCGRELDDACFWSSDKVCDQCYAMNPTDE